MSLLTSSWLIVLGVVVLALIYVAFNYFRIKKMPEGTAEMIELSGIIRSGAQTFLKTEFKSIAIVVAAVAVIFTLCVEKTSGITFLIGALMSSIVCVLGMQSATYANVRTSNKARESLSIGETVKVALCGGSISGKLTAASAVMFRMCQTGIRHLSICHLGQDRYTKKRRQKSLLNRKMVWDHRHGSLFHTSKKGRDQRQGSLMEPEGKERHSYGQKVARLEEGHCSR